MYAYTYQNIYLENLMTCLPAGKIQDHIYLENHGRITGTVNALSLEALTKISPTTHTLTWCTNQHTTNNINTHNIGLLLNPFTTTHTWKKEHNHYTQNPENLPIGYIKSFLKQDLNTTALWHHLTPTDQQTAIYSLINKTTPTHIEQPILSPFILSGELHYTGPTLEDWAKHYPNRDLRKRAKICLLPITAETQNFTATEQDFYTNVTLEHIYFFTHLFLTHYTPNSLTAFHTAEKLWQSGCTPEEVVLLTLSTIDKDEPHTLN